MNLYSLSYCPKCKGFHLGSQLNVHGADNLNKAVALQKHSNLSLQEIYNSFCGYCGSYIEGKECTCKHTRRQRYYEE